MTLSKETTLRNTLSDFEIRNSKLYTKIFFIYKFIFDKQSPAGIVNK